MVLGGERLYIRIHNRWRIDSSLSRPALSPIGDMSELSTDQPTPFDPKLYVYVLIGQVELLVVLQNTQ